MVLIAGDIPVFAAVNRAGYPGKSIPNRIAPAAFVGRPFILLTGCGGAPYKIFGKI
jgi:hypothetical protein